MTLEKFIIPEKLDSVVSVESAEESRQKLNGDSCGDKKTQPSTHLEGEEVLVVKEEPEYIDSYGIEASSTVDAARLIQLGILKALKALRIFLNGVEPL
ncbi:MAG: hypothetical protein PHW84_08905 [Methanosarcina sp.]|nr:hypothetical protein [Methanosarcina sp.]